MIILNQVHGKLARILHNLLADTILYKGFLHQDVAAVFFITQDISNLVNPPFLTASRIRYPCGFQLLPDHAQAGALQVSVKDTPI